MSEPYSGTIHEPGATPPPSPPRPGGIFIRGGGAARAGITMGSTLAMVISWSVNHSIIWAMVHGVLSWLYVLYYALTRGP